MREQKLQRLLERAISLLTDLFEDRDLVDEDEPNNDLEEILDEARELGCDVEEES